jgi:hypothetical protein
MKERRLWCKIVLQIMNVQQIKSDEKNYFNNLVQVQPSIWPTIF